MLSGSIEVDSLIVGSLAPSASLDGSLSPNTTLDCEISEKSQIGGIITPVKSTEVFAVDNGFGTTVVIG